MMETLKRKRDEGGFTLIELLIVIIILAILAAIVVFAVGTTGQNAAAAACQGDAKAVETAIESYKAQFPYAYPPASDAGGWLVLVPPVGSGKPQYLREQPSTTHYAINFNASGQVSADTKGTVGYNLADDISQAPPNDLAAICAKNAT